MPEFRRHCPQGAGSQSFLGEGDADAGRVAGSRLAARGRGARAVSCVFAHGWSHSAMRRSHSVRRFASLGVALALAIGTLVPVAHAQTGKTLVMGFTQEPDTFVAGEGGLYVTQVA